MAMKNIVDEDENVRSITASVLGGLSAYSDQAQVSDILIDLMAESA
eukprot:gene26978-35407_t